MATRSRIGLLMTDGSVLSYYHHWDGYPSWLGVTLEDKFNTKDSVSELIDGGDMSSCDSDTDWNNDKIDGPTRPLYYSHRGEDVPPRLDSDLKEFLTYNTEEYHYLFNPCTHKWTCYEMVYGSRKSEDSFREVEIKDKIGIRS